MGFRLFGVDVEIQIGFWIMAFFFGWGGGTPGPEVLIWMLAVFVSVLIHEYGHALAIKRLVRTEPEIVLHWMGGHTTWGAALPVSRRDHILVSLAGPFAGFLFGSLVFGIAMAMGASSGGLLSAMLGEGWEIGGRMPPAVRRGIINLLFVNFYWGLINLAPVLPFDGGHVLEHAIGPSR